MKIGKVKPSQGGILGKIGQEKNPDIDSVCFSLVIGYERRMFHC
jgi:hypothetical protein